MFDIYICSSWSNRTRIRSFAARIRNTTNFSVFDFTDMNDRKERVMPPEVVSHSATSYDDFLQQFQHTVRENSEVIRACKLVLLFLPCGIDAHADWAYGVGLGKLSLVIGYPKNGDYLATHLWANAIVEDTTQAIDWLKELEIVS